MSKQSKSRLSLPAYRLDLKYLGGDFEGWQSQPLGTGIQDHVEKALETLLRHPVRVVAASRTDSGVHAEHQVAVFHTDVPFEAIRWLKSLHGLLPKSVGVTALTPVAQDFHPVYAAKAKVYRYRLWLGPTRNPLVAPFCWHLPATEAFVAERLIEEAAHLVGSHDFTSFCAADGGAKTRVRDILAIEVTQTGPLLDIWILGKGFLKQMVRIIVGTLVDAAYGKLGLGGIRPVLAARDRTQAGRTAPAQGLALVEIFYDEVPSIETMRARLAAGFCLKIT